MSLVLTVLLGLSQAISKKLERKGALSLHCPTRSSLDLPLLTSSQPGQINVRALKVPGHPLSSSADSLGQLLSTVMSSPESTLALFCGTRKGFLI